MRNMIQLAGAALLLAAHPAALGQGQDKGKGDARAAEQRGGAQDRADRRGPQRRDDARTVARGKSADRSGEERDRGDDRRPAVRADARQEKRADSYPERAAGGPAFDGMGERARDRSRIRVVEHNRYRWRSVLRDGCPPGLVQKRNGCLPPGQARRLAAERDHMRYWSRYAPWYEDARRYDWRFGDGYAWRLDPASGMVLGYTPLLGGALFPGRLWPDSYADYAVDPYYGRYYDVGGPYNYRYANGALFAVDPETQAIAAIAALLAGDDWAVGSPMPPGYGAYNVPPPYRARYYDTADDWYRYSDGYVYRVDPTTLLVREMIALLT